MIGALIGAGLSAVSGIASAIAAKKQKDKARALQKKQLKTARADYVNDYYGDATKRADTIHHFAEMRKDVMKRRNAAHGTKELMGGTDDSEKAVMEANNKVIADTTGNLVAANEARKDRVKAAYQERRDRILDNIGKGYNDQASIIANTGKAVAQVASNVANAIDYTQGNAAKAGEGLAPSGMEQYAQGQGDIDKLNALVGNGSGGSIADMYKKGGASV